MLQELRIARGRNDRTIRVEGSIAAHNAPVFAQVLEQDVVAMAAPDTVDLDLDELELSDDEAIEMALNGLRSLLRKRRLVLRNAPELLARKLHALKDLEAASLELIKPRGGPLPTLT
jgi:hypothetical protein